MPTETNTSREGWGALIAARNSFAALRDVPSPPSRPLRAARQFNP